MVKEAAKGKPAETGNSLRLFPGRVLRWLVGPTAGRTKEELRMGEERFRLLADNASDMIIRIQLSPTFKTDYVSPSSKRIIGYAPEEFYAEPELGLQIIHPEDRALFLKYANLEGPEHHPVTLRMVRKDGAVIWTEQTFAAIRDKSGKPVAVHAISRDITERKQMEQALTESSERLRTLSEESPVVICNIDLDGAFQYVNKKFEEVTKYSRAEVLAKNSFEAGMFREELRPFLRERMQAQIKGGPPSPVEVEFIRKDDEIIWLSMIAEAIRDNDKLLGLQIIAQDVTERRRMEEKIQAEENKLQSLIGAMDCTLTIQDRDFNIIYQNEASKLASGGDHIGEKCYSVYEGRDNICVGCPVAKAFKDSKSHTSERQRLEPSGEITLWENTANPIRDAEGNIVSCVEVARDITEHKKAEQALADEATQRHILIDQSLDGIVVLDEDAKVVEANQKFAEMLGYTPEEVRELHTWDWDKQYPPEKLREMGRNVDEKGLHLETKHHCKDGSVIDVEISVNGAIVAGRKLIFCVCRDITERKQLVEEMRKSEERYRRIFESANDIIILLDNKGDIVDVNPQVSAIGGYTREQLLGKNFKTLTKVMPKKSVAIVAKNFMLRMMGVDVPSYEVEMYRGDGTKLNVEISAVAVKDKDKIIGTLATLHDVTERHKAESAIKYQRELIDQILATTPNAVMVVDKDMKVLLANTTFCKKFGLKKAAVENKPIHRIIKGEELEQAVAGAIKNNKKSLSLEFRYELKGVPRIFIATIARMQSNRYLVLLNDVTEEREKQQRLYLTDRLASVGEMASGVAHELNNPLTSIIGLSSLMTGENNIPAGARKDLMAINSEAQRCATIVKNLLAFARKHEPRRDSLQVDKIVEDVLKLRAYEHRSHNVNVAADLPEDLPQVLGDYFQLQQVFLNIILNAETSMMDAGGGGTLKITGERTDGYVRISFSDNGPGIAKDTMGLIFNPFFTTKAVGKGTGLGLSIAYGIIAAHGGKIYAKNNKDKGATFFVELPVVDN